MARRPEGGHLGVAGFIATLSAAPLAIAISTEGGSLRSVGLIIGGCLWAAAFVVAWPELEPALNPHLLERVRAWRWGRSVTGLIREGDLQWECPFCGNSYLSTEACSTCGAVLDQERRRAKRPKGKA